MSKIAALALLFVATGLAAPSVVAREDSNVLLGVNARFLGSPDDTLNLPVTLGVCKDLPTKFNHTLSAIAPNSGLQCQIFDAAKCDALNSRFINGRVDDLATIDFDNQAESIRCIRLPTV